MYRKRACQCQLNVVKNTDLRNEKEEAIEGCILAELYLLVCSWAQ